MDVLLKKVDEWSVSIKSGAEWSFLNVPSQVSILRKLIVVCLKCVSLVCFFINIPFHKQLAEICFAHIAKHYFLQYIRESAWQGRLLELSLRFFTQTVK